MKTSACCVLAACLVCAGCDAKFFPSSPTQTPGSVTSPTTVVTTPATKAAASVPATPSAEVDQVKPPMAPPETPAVPETSPASTETTATTGTLHADAFADLAGAITWNRDGVKTAEGPRNSRTIYFFAGMAEGGPLAMKICEDHVTKGPDDKPGVLALSWQEIPPKLPHSGFVYLGGRDDSARLKLPPLKLAKTAEDLKPLRLKFRYKVVNEKREKAFTFAVDCRLEPMLADSYKKRIDFGTLHATGEWATFESALAAGKNLDAFLAAVATESPPAFKIVWAQSGTLSLYQPGDTLLIDDIEVIAEK